MLKRKYVIAAAAVVVLAGAGTATALTVSGDDGPAATTSAGAAGAAGAAGHANGNAAKAVATAVSAVPGTVTGVDLEDDGREWDVDVFGKDHKWHDVTVDAAGTRAVGDRLDDDNEGRDRNAPRGAPVTVRQAMDAALKAVPGRVTEVDLERGHWEVEVRGADGRHSDVNVDARTGGAKVVKDQDSDDDRAAGTSGSAGDDGRGTAGTDPSSASDTDADD
ncbi:PepSY domain-containing protein [Streptomyces sp. NPDC004111]|uniref:PepSY domain-containing protein n=1 Tax=Streptomyces sp. NPDC004111 TaxID=3364690 RepID=UPI003676A5D9